MDPLASLYAGSRAELRIPNHTPPSQFAHGKETLVAECPKAPEDGDGQALRVYETRYPAIFHRIEVIAGLDSLGGQKAGYEIKTGSGQQHLVTMLVEAITTGMVGIYPEPQP